MCELFSPEILQAVAVKGLMLSQSVIRTQSELADSLHTQIACTPER